MSHVSTNLAEARARLALREAGLPHQGRLERASSTRNEIFLSDQHVVRVNGQLNHRLRREARLYASLPAAPWTPTAVAMGGEFGADYLIVERKPGGPLAHAWPALTTQQRRRAVDRLAACLKELHSTPTPAHVPPLEPSLHLLDTAAAPPVRPLLEGIDRLTDDPRADRGLVNAVRDYVVANAGHLDGFDGSHLIHGDLTFENLLWDGTDLSAVVDFEWCRGAPADFDLDVLLRCCAFPDAHVAPDHEKQTRAEDYAEVPGWLAEDYPGLFAHPRLLERLTLYALSFDVRASLEAPLPASRTGVSDIHPYNRLSSLISTGGHVADALDRIGLPAGGPE